MPSSGYASLPLLACVALASVAHAEPRVTKGPYTVNVTPNAVRVLVELEAPASVELSVEGPAGVPPQRLTSEPILFHSFAVTSLLPATSYVYAVSVDGARTASGRFRTAPEPGQDGAHLMIFGDNRTVDAAHGAVVAAMTRRNPDFVLNTGDLVEDGEVVEQWQRFFEIERALLSATVLFPTPGNHDLQGSGEGHENYRRFMGVPESRPLYYAFTYGSARFFVLDSNDDWSIRGPQRVWLEEELANAARDATIAHRIVVAHHGPYSSGFHGDHEEMQASGVPELLRSARVSLVLSAHDHDYERGDAEGLKYIVTGGGGAPLYDEHDVLPSQLAFRAVHHFLDVAFDAERLDVKAIEPSGRAFEDCGFALGQPWQCRIALATPAPAERQTRAVALLQKRWVVVALALGGVFVIVVVWIVRRRRREPPRA